MAEFFGCLFTFNLINNETIVNLLIYILTHERGEIVWSSPRECKRVLGNRNERSAEGGREEKGSEGGRKEESK